MPRRDPEPEEELFEFDESEMLAAAREEAETAYPNPERADCPGRDVLEAIARGRMDRAEAKAHFSHITHCSQCWREYTEIRGQVRNRRAAGGAALGILVLAAGWLGYRAWGPEPTETAVALVDLRRTPNLRGSGNAAGAATVSGGPVPALRLDLRIYLPTGSESGSYEVSIWRGPILAAGPAAGTTSIESGIDVLRASMNGTRVAKGVYSLRLVKEGTELGDYVIRFD